MGIKRAKSEAESLRFNKDPAGHINRVVKSASQDAINNLLVKAATEIASSGRDLSVFKGVSSIYTDRFPDANLSDVVSEISKTVTDVDKIVTISAMFEVGDEYKIIQAKRDLEVALNRLSQIEGKSLEVDTKNQAVLTNLAQINAYVKDISALCDGSAECSRQEYLDRANTILKQVEELKTEEAFNAFSDALTGANADKNDANANPQDADEANALSAIVKKINSACEKAEKQATIISDANIAVLNIMSSAKEIVTEVKAVISGEVEALVARIEATTEGVSNLESKEITLENAISTADGKNNQDLTLNEGASKSLSAAKTALQNLKAELSKVKALKSDLVEKTLISAQDKSPKELDDLATSIKTSLESLETSIEGAQTQALVLENKVTEVNVVLEADASLNAQVFTLAGNDFSLAEIKLANMNMYLYDDALISACIKNVIEHKAIERDDKIDLKDSCDAIQTNLLKTCKGFEDGSVNAIKTIQACKDIYVEFGTSDIQVTSALLIEYCTNNSLLSGDAVNFLNSFSASSI